MFAVNKILRKRGPNKDFYSKKGKMKFVRLIFKIHKIIFLVLEELHLRNPLSNSLVNCYKKVKNSKSKLNKSKNKETKTL